MTVMTCRDVIEFLSAYLDGELAAEERETFEAHLAECPDCVRYLRTYEDAVTLARGAFDPNHPLPPDVPDKLVQAILAARRKV